MQMQEETAENPETEDFRIQGSLHLQVLIDSNF